MSQFHPVYDALLGEWERELADLEKKIFQALRAAYPGSLTRRELIRAVYGVVVDKDGDLNNNAMDRKIRKTIAAMFDNLIPVVSSSGSAGYRLDLSEENILKVISELQRRRDEYTRKIERAETLRLRIRQRQAALPESLPDKPQQMTFFR